MFDIGMTELLVIGIVSLIVVGPKDLPGMFRTLGKFTAKARSMAREFSRAMEDAADESGVKDVATDLRKMSNPTKMGLDKLNEAADDFAKWDPSKKTGDAKSADAKPDAPKPAKGPETEKLSKERASQAEKIRDAMAEAAIKRKAASAEAEATKAVAKKATKPAAKTARKTATKTATKPKPKTASKAAPQRPKASATKRKAPAKTSPKASE